jgi:hypothetical protein
MLCEVINGPNCRLASRNQEAWCSGRMVPLPQYTYWMMTYEIIFLFVKLFVSAVCTTQDGSTSQDVRDAKPTPNPTPLCFPPVQSRHWTMHCTHTHTHTHTHTQKVQFSLSMPRTHVGGEVQLHSFLSSALDGREWLTSRSGRCALWKERRYLLNRRLGGLVGLWAGLDFYGKRKISCPYSKWKPVPFSPCGPE